MARLADSRRLAWQVDVAPQDIRPERSLRAAAVAGHRRRRPRAGAEGPGRADRGPGRAGRDRRRRGAGVRRHGQPGGDVHPAGRHPAHPTGGRALRRPYARLRGVPARRHGAARRVHYRRSSRGPGAGARQRPVVHRGLRCGVRAALRGGLPAAGRRAGHRRRAVRRLLADRQRGAVRPAAAAHRVHGGRTAGGLVGDPRPAGRRCRWQPGSVAGGRSPGAGHRALPGPAAALADRRAPQPRPDDRGPGRRRGRPAHLGAGRGPPQHRQPALRQPGWSSTTTRMASAPPRGTTWAARPCGWPRPPRTAAPARGCPTRWPRRATSGWSSRTTPAGTTRPPRSWSASATWSTHPPACGCGAATGRSSDDLLKVLGDLISGAISNSFDLVPPGAHVPRVTIDDLVVVRERWALTAGDVAFADTADERARYLQARAWAASHGLPRHVFVRFAGERKPIYADLTSLASIDLISRSLRRSRRHAGADAPVTVVEMLPAPDQAWLTDARGQRYTAELRMSWPQTRTGKADRGCVRVPHVVRPAADVAAGRDGPRRADVQHRLGGTAGRCPRCRRAAAGLGRGAGPARGAAHDVPQRVRRPGAGDRGRAGRAAAAGHLRRGLARGRARAGRPGADPRPRPGPVRPGRRAARPGHPGPAGAASARAGGRDAPHRRGRLVVPGPVRRAVDGLRGDHPRRRPGRGGAPDPVRRLRDLAARAGRGRRERPAERFWRAELADAPSVLALPTDRPYPARQTFAAESITSTMDAGLADAVRELAARNGTSLFAVLLSRVRGGAVPADRQRRPAGRGADGGPYPVGDRVRGGAVHEHRPDPDPDRPGRDAERPDAFRPRRDRACAGAPGAAVRPDGGAGPARPRSGPAAAGPGDVRDGGVVGRPGPGRAGAGARSWWRTAPPSSSSS